MGVQQMMDNKLGGMDYAALAAEGTAYLKQLSGQTWNDFYPHDPGITLLEYLCYAISDLCYRLNFPMADLLATAEYSDTALTKHGFFSAREILTTAPVTLVDYRRLLIDLSDDNGQRLLKNAWIEPIKELGPKGFYRVYLDEIGPLTAEQKAALIPQAKRLLAAQRNLCEDFAEIILLKKQYIFFKIAAQITEGTDVNELAARIYYDLQAFLSPTVRFCSLETLLKEGKSAEDIFNGPILKHGFIDEAELDRCPQQTVIHVSNVISLIQKLPGVEAVYDVNIISKPSILLVSSDTEIVNEMLKPNMIALQNKDEQLTAYWLKDNEQNHQVLPLLPEELSSLPAFPDESQAAVKLSEVDNEPLVNKIKLLCDFTLKGFSLSDSLTVDPNKTFRLGELSTQLKHMVFSCREVNYTLDEKRVEAHLNRLKWRPPLPGTNLAQDISVPAGRDRELAHYISIQKDLPAYYGIKETLPDSAGAHKIAQARQLKAYLLIFDQILADYCVQLDQAKHLLAINTTPMSAHQTIFHQSVTDVSELDQLLKAPHTYLSDLLKIKDEHATTQELEHKDRLLNHLLARFCEEFTGDALKPLFSDTEHQPAPSNPSALLTNKSQFLKNYAQLSYQRGQAFNHQFMYNRSNCSGLEKRIASMLGAAYPLASTIESEEGEQEPLFYLIEHHLLAPPDALTHDTDLFSFQISLLFPNKFHLAQAAIAEMISSQIPAHIYYSLYWLNAEQFTECKQTIKPWLEALTQDDPAILNAAATTVWNWLQHYQNE
jgi:hypothetical protein